MLNSGPYLKTQQTRADIIERCVSRRVYPLPLIWFDRSSYRPFQQDFTIFISYRQNLKTKVKATKNMTINKTIDVLNHAYLYKSEGRDKSY